MSPATVLFVQIRLDLWLPKALRPEKIQVTLLLDLVGWFCALYLQGFLATLFRGHLVQKGPTYVVQKEIISILLWGKNAITKQTQNVCLLSMNSNYDHAPNI